ncbi:hypothetical protein [Tenacibaculum sp. 190524A02b]|uniref:hypothetical protein n=1 Tax=Tenacibaculum vairaonense TaxID=3137860 RepID=UPI0031FA6128
MLIKIESHLFEERGSDSLRHMDDIMYTVVDSIHDLYIDDVSILDSNWAKNARASLKNLIKSAIKNSKRTSKKPNIFISDNNKIAQKIYNLRNGKIFLTNKPIFFVENGENDGNFIKALLFKFNSKKALHLIQNNLIEIKHCGGKHSIRTEIDRELRKYRTFELDNHNYVRFFVLRDSDKNHAEDDRRKEEISTIVNYCSEKNISIHILEKRAIENYLPLNILEKDNLKIDTNILGTLKKLTPEQYDFIDISNGFNNKSRDKLGPLFQEESHLSNDDYNILKNKGVHSNDFNSKKEIPKLFLDEILTHKMLVKRCEHQKEPNELKIVIDKINSIL